MWYGVGGAGVQDKEDPNCGGVAEKEGERERWGVVFGAVMT